MGVSKVALNGTTLIDISNTTATASTVLTGSGCYGADGEWIDGTATGGSGSGVVWQDAQGYVHLSNESDIELQTKTATPSETAQVVTADSGYYALDKVNVEAISSTYVGTGITRRSSIDLTASEATVTVPAGYYASQASKAVASGTAGTPTATKGTVSNHSISVTPSVTNSTGWITGSTKTGTAVSVSASELVSGTKSITENGTGIDVTDYASVDVDVASGGASLVSVTITANSNANSHCFILVNNGGLLKQIAPSTSSTTYRIPDYPDNAGYALLVSITNNISYYPIFTATSGTVSKVSGGYSGNASVINVHMVSEGAVLNMTTGDAS